DLRFCIVVSSFFFQAEDGIRDRNVTGVQTCALPISNSPKGNMVSFPKVRLLRDVALSRAPSQIYTVFSPEGVSERSSSSRFAGRSEERRVGTQSTEAGRRQCHVVETWS